MPTITPSAESDAAELADHRELMALEAKDRNASCQDLVARIKRSGEVARRDHGDEESQRCASDAILECEERSEHCGVDPYPFDVKRDLIEVKSGDPRLAYRFLLLLSIYGINAGPKGTHGARLFEQLSVHAAKGYFGVKDADVAHFGFPRANKSGFKKALANLCRTALREGSPSRRSPNIANAQDGSLDVVVWRPFPDARAGKFIGFGQCAAGRDAAGGDKLCSLEPSGFMRTWLEEQFGCKPVRLFFVPERLLLNQWRDRVMQLEGVLFDRCRIAATARDLPADLRDQLKAWVEFVLAKRVRTP